jgi:hypothetical protein
MRICSPFVERAQPNDLDDQGDLHTNRESPGVIHVINTRRSQERDHAIPPATERFMAQRAGATTVEVNSSHVAMISKPSAVTDLIIDAVKATT